MVSVACAVASLELLRQWHRMRGQLGGAWTHVVLSDTHRLLKLLEACETSHRRVVVHRSQGLSLLHSVEPRRRRAHVALERGPRGEVARPCAGRVTSRQPPESAAVSGGRSRSSGRGVEAEAEVAWSRLQPRTELMRAVCVREEVALSQRPRHRAGLGLGALRGHIGVWRRVLDLDASVGVDGFDESVHVVVPNL